jgi:hypothetical protein
MWRTDESLFWRYCCQTDDNKPSVITHNLCRQNHKNFAMLRSKLSLTYPRIYLRIVTTTKSWTPSGQTANNLPVVCCVGAITCTRTLLNTYKLQLQADRKIESTSMVTGTEERQHTPPTTGTAGMLKKSSNFTVSSSNIPLPSGDRHNYATSLPYKTLGWPQQKGGCGNFPVIFTPTLVHVHLAMTYDGRTVAHV